MTPINKQLVLPILRKYLHEGYCLSELIDTLTLENIEIIWYCIGTALRRSGEFKRLDDDYIRGTDPLDLETFHDALVDVQNILGVIDRERGICLVEHFDDGTIYDKKWRNQYDKLTFTKAKVSDIISHLPERYEFNIDKYEAELEQLIDDTNKIAEAEAKETFEEADLPF